MRISDWSSDVCSSDLSDIGVHARANGIGEEVADSGFRPSDRGTAAVERRQRFANGDVQLFRELVEVDLHLGRHGSIRLDVLGREDAELRRPHELLLAAIVDRVHGHLDDHEIVALGTGLDEGELAVVDRKSTRLNSRHKYAYRM